ncbi:DUF4007 family protein [Lentisphaerota bacterium WC36G]|nr:DUF4007 family protein [Lentisphaerae bacterium WC36]
MNIDFSFFAGHESFYLRSGWLSKGIEAIKNNSEIFLTSNLKDAIDNLGIGANMVKSLKYWLEFCNIIEKEKKNTSKYNLTSFGKNIYDIDFYCLNKGTLWLLHYHSCVKSPLWKVMFCEEDISYFDKEKASIITTARIKEEGTKYARKTIDSAISVFINTYLWANKTSKEEPEDNLNSPLAELKLLQKDNNNNYCFRALNSNEIPPMLIYLIIFGSKIKRNSLPLDLAFKEIRKYLKIDLNSLREILNRLENDNYIQVDRAAGLNNIINKANLTTEKIEQIIIEEV